MRKLDFKAAFKIYAMLAKQFEDYKDFQTASYFHKRCLDISVEHKYIEGEAKSYLGLGNAEEQVMNKEQAMIHLETALEKASEDPQRLEQLIKNISTKIVKVYTSVANEYQEVGNFGEALQYFEKC